MARRSALEAVLGALGGGFSGYARDQQNRYSQEQDTLDREERRKRELADALAAAEQRKISLFQSGLEEAAPLTERAGNMGRASQAVQAVSGMQAPGMPVGMSAVSRALAGASSGMTSDISRGRKLSVDGTDYVQPFSRTAEGRAEAERRQAQSDDRVDTMNQKERDAQLAENALKLEGLRGRNAERTATARTPGVGGDPSGRGPLPTVTNAITDLRALTPAAIRGLRAGSVQTVQESPMLVSQAKGPLEWMGARGIQAIGNEMATEAEQKYALQARAVSDAVARANERGVLSNQDNDRYIRQVSLVTGDKPEIKELKVRNLIQWAEWLTGANQMLADGATPEQVQASASALADRLDLAEWTTRNPFDETKETADQYRARARAAIQQGGR